MLSPSLVDPPPSVVIGRPLPPLPPALSRSLRQRVLIILILLEAVVGVSGLHGASNVDHVLVLPHVWSTAAIAGSVSIFWRYKALRLGFDQYQVTVLSFSIWQTLAQGIAFAVVFALTRVSSISDLMIRGDHVDLRVVL